MRSNALILTRSDVIGLEDLPQLVLISEYVVTDRAYAKWHFHCRWQRGHLPNGADGIRGYLRLGSVRGSGERVSARECLTSARQRVSSGRRREGTAFYDVRESPSSGRADTSPCTEEN